MKRALIFLVLGAVTVGACGADDADTAHTGKLQIVATTTILGDIVQHITDSDADVATLVPVGADPHDYTPSPQQVAAIQTADLVLANGLGLEEGLDDVLDAAEQDGARILRLAPLLNPAPFATAGDLDPHVWLDPVRMAEGALLIGEALAELDRDIDWVVRAQAHARRLTALDQSITDTLSAIPSSRRKLVTNHDALGYFAARYGLEVVGVVVPGGSTLAEPSSAALAELVETIRREEVPAIFAETTEPAALAEAVAAEVGSDVAVVELYTGSLGAAGSGAVTYVDMMLTNADRIATALR